MAERITAEAVREKLATSGHPVLLVCWFDKRGAPLHPCGKAARALEQAGIAHERIVHADGRPLSIGTKDTRPELAALTGGREQLPALVLPDGTSVVGSGAIAAWAADHAAA